jgi:uncharacterized protein
MTPPNAPAAAPAPAHAGHVPSPCIGVCRMHERTGWCVGCLRTIEEIIAWGRATPEDQRRIWALLPARREAAAPLHGTPP